MIHMVCIVVCLLLTLYLVLVVSFLLLRAEVATHPKAMRRAADAVRRLRRLVGRLLRRRRGGSKNGDGSGGGGGGGSDEGDGGDGALGAASTMSASHAQAQLQQSVLRWWRHGDALGHTASGTANGNAANTGDDGSDGINDGTGAPDRRQAASTLLASNRWRGWRDGAIEPPPFWWFVVESGAERRMRCARNHVRANNPPPAPLSQRCHTLPVPKLRLLFRPSSAQPPSTLHPFSHPRLGPGTEAAARARLAAAGARLARDQPAELRGAPLRPKGGVVPRCAAAASRALRGET